MATWRSPQNGAGGVLDNEVAAPSAKSAPADNKMLPAIRGSASGRQNGGTGTRAPSGNIGSENTVELAALPADANVTGAAAQYRAPMVRSS
jgi:hypothetical protein